MSAPEDRVAQALREIVEFGAADPWEFSPADARREARRRPVTVIAAHLGATSHAGRPRQPGVWPHRVMVVAVAAVILAVFFVPLPHISLFRRFITSSNSSIATTGPGNTPIGKQLTELKGSDTVPGDGFGVPVAISGTIAIVGASQHAKQGRAYVFTERKGLWQQTDELEASDTVRGAYFGDAVAISGRNAVVGAPGAAKQAGRAYVFTETDGTWKQTAELKGSDTTGQGCNYDLCPGGSFFGTSVAISGAIAVVGASNQAGEAGRAYVFTETKGTWKQTAELHGSTAHVGAQFGTSVAISDETILVGANGDPTGGGRAYVFAETPEGWTQVAVLKGSDTGMNDYFGSAVTISGTTAIVGAYAHGEGRAYVFTSTNGAWKQAAELGTDSAVNGYLFGDSVAIAGATAVIGANGDAEGAGRAFVFAQGEHGWAQIAELAGSDTASRDSFGSSVAISGAIAIVGAPSHARGAGTAYLFKA
jgi:hypothetical protein